MLSDSGCLYQATCGFQSILPGDCLACDDGIGQMPSDSGRLYQATGTFQSPRMWSAAVFEAPRNSPAELVVLIASKNEKGTAIQEDDGVGAGEVV